MRTPRETISERLACDEDILAKLAAHAARLHTARESAVAAFAAAQAHLKTLDVEIANVEAHMGTVRCNIDDLRAQLQPCTITERLPNELLRAIFTKCDPAPWHNKYGRFKPLAYEHGQALWPFSVSAVCRRWRTLSLQTPELWSHIIIPQPATDLASNNSFALLEAHLQRSRPLPIVVGLPWHEDLWDDRLARPLVRALAQESVRWQGISLQYVSGNVPPGIDELLQRPTPLLEYFFSERSINAPRTLTSPVRSRPALSLCPTLRYMHWENTAVLPSTSASGLPSLVSLKVAVDMTASAVWQFLRACPSLEAISVEFMHDRVAVDVTEVLTDPLSLPRLKQVEPGHIFAQILSTNATNVSFPSLERIDIRSSTLPALRPFLDVVRDSVKTLNITSLSAHNAQHIDCLRALAGVRQLALGFSADEALGAAQTALLDGLAETDWGPDDWLLPQLETISVHGNVTREAGDALVALIAARTAGLGVQLKEVVFGRHGPGTAPEFVKAHVDARLHSING